MSLAIRRWSPDGHNCELEPVNGSTARYLGDLRELHDENTGRDDKPVRLGRKNIRLVLDTEIIPTCGRCRLRGSCATARDTLHLTATLFRHA